MKNWSKIDKWSGFGPLSIAGYCGVWRSLHHSSLKVSKSPANDRVKQYQNKMGCTYFQQQWFVVYWQNNTRILLQAGTYKWLILINKNETKAICIYLQIIILNKISSLHRNCWGYHTETMICTHFLIPYIHIQRSI